MFLWLKLNLFILNILMIVSSLNETNLKDDCTQGDPSFFEYRDVSNLSWNVNFFPIISIIPVSCYELCSFEFTSDRIRLYDCRSINVNFTFKRIGQKQFNYMVQLNTQELPNTLFDAKKGEIIDVEMNIYYSDFESVFIFHGCFTFGNPIQSYNEIWFVFENRTNNTKFIEKYRENYQPVDLIYQIMWAPDTYLMKPCGFIYFNTMNNQKADITIVPKAHVNNFDFVIAAIVILSILALIVVSVKALIRMVDR